MTCSKKALILTGVALYVGVFVWSYWLLLEMAVKI